MTRNLQPPRSVSSENKTKKVLNKKMSKILNNKCVHNIAEVDI